jgi:nucleoside phosphorylase
MKRLVLLALAVSLVASVPAASRAAGSDGCARRILVLSAFPAEIGPLLAKTSVAHVDEVGDRQFTVGTLMGHDVVLSLTGIGLVNAEATTRAALAHFACGDDSGISAVVFSGVSGGRTYIGDVTVPARWNDGTHWFTANADMLATAASVKANVHLSNVNPLGDPACAGIDPDTIQTVAIAHTPDVLIGGDGESSDGFGGRALPCFPNGDDVFGCRPCAQRGANASEATSLVTHGAPFVDPSFFAGYFQATPPPGVYDAADMETAAVAKVATEAGVPFIAFRALSDGLGDPLNLPGFPFQFFFYKQLAADNAAAMATAFLGAWNEK